MLKNARRQTAENVDAAMTAAPAIERFLAPFTLLAAMAVGLYYFTWLLNSARIDNLALYAPLVAADLFNFGHAITFWIMLSLRDQRRANVLPDRRPKAHFDPSSTIDIFVPTLNESREILDRTLNACAAVRWGMVRVHVLDDGGRDWVKALAEGLNIRYLSRGTRRGAKAGNINDALKNTSGEFVVVFDADHAPSPDFLERTMPEFADGHVAVVQTPQVYGNSQESAIAAASKQQQDLFYQIILPGKARLGGAFSCGTNVVYRRAALDAVDGIAEDSIVEDMKTSMLLHAKGWEAVYVNEDLAVGLGPSDIASFWHQQRRWASGCLALLTSRALWTPRLSPIKKWHYLTSLSYFAVGWAVLVYSLLPILRLFFGWSAIDRDTDEFVLRFVPYFILSLFILGAQTQGRFGFQGLLMVWGSFGIHILATFDAVVRRRLRFRVTPKSRQAGSPIAYLWPNLLIVLLSGAAIIYGLLGDTSPSTINNAAFAAFNSVIAGGIIVLAYQQTRQVEVDRGAERGVLLVDRSPRGRLR